MADTNSNTCVECRGKLRPAGTETVCEQCGLVHTTDAIDRGPEWRAFDDQQDRRRTGAPLTRSRHDRGLSTEIGYCSASAPRITGRKRRQLARLRREHNRARISTKADRNQVYGFTEIRRIVAELSLPTTVRDQACQLFKSAQSTDLLKGRSLEGFAAATVYAVCRINSLARTLTEVATVSRADERELKVAYAALNTELGLPTGPIHPTEYLPRYASKLDLEAEIERQARTYVTRLFDAGCIGGRNPSGVAAACLYAAALSRNISLTQTAAAAVADVSPVTIRSTVADIDALE